VHKILLNSVLLSPIVSGGVWPKLPGQTPLGHNPPCFLPFVGQLGSGSHLVGQIGSGVRVSVSFQQKYPPGSVLRQRKTELWPRGLCPGGGLTSVSGAYNVEPVTNTSSSFCANNGDGRRRECSARQTASWLYFSHFATRRVYNTVDLYAEIFVQNRVFCLPHLHSTPPLGRFPS